MELRSKRSEWYARPARVLPIRTVLMTRDHDIPSPPAVVLMVMSHRVFRSLAFREDQVRPGRVLPRFWPTRADLQAPLPSLDTGFAMVLGGRGGDRGDGADTRHHYGDVAAAHIQDLEAAPDIDGTCP